MFWPNCFSFLFFPSPPPHPFFFFFAYAQTVIYTIQFQQRGLLHAHILVFLDKNSKISSAEQIGEIILEEIPDLDKDPVVHAIVKKFMIHGSCGSGLGLWAAWKRESATRTSPKNSMTRQLSTMMASQSIGRETQVYL